MARLQVRQYVIDHFNKIGGHSQSYTLHIASARGRCMNTHTNTQHTQCDNEPAHPSRLSRYTSRQSLSFILPSPHDAYLYAGATNELNVTTIGKIIFIGNRHVLPPALSRDCQDLLISCRNFLPGHCLDLVGGLQDTYWALDNTVVLRRQDRVMGHQTRFSGCFSMR